MERRKECSSCALTPTPIFIISLRCVPIISSGTRFVFKCHVHEMHNAICFDATSHNCNRMHLRYTSCSYNPIGAVVVVACDVPMHFPTNTKTLMNNLAGFVLLLATCLLCACMANFTQAHFTLYGG